MMKLCMISLGCDKNLVDSENMLTLLEKGGYTFTDAEEEADIIIVNSCCFILDAREESISTVLRAADYKHTGTLKKLIVAGCLAERYRQEIIDEIPEVDAVIGTASYDRILEVLQDAECDGTGGKNPDETGGETGSSVYTDELTRLPAQYPNRIVSTGGWYGYLKIAEGCDKRCTYCIIPYLRGGYRSYPMEALVEQARIMAEGGVKELILVAQETTVYGKDIYGRKMLPELLRKLCAIDDLRWIRILYAYPEEIDDELISVMASEEKIVKYIDMPIQHASDSILKRMGRRTDHAALVDIIGKLRAAMPDIALRTTLISGFPGETEEDHEELLDFVDEMEFTKLGVFPYSAEEGTPAEQFPDQVPQEVREQRRDEIMELQQEISTDVLSRMTGKLLDVMIEGWIPEDRVYVGRTYMDAPEIDGMVFIESARRHESGDFIKAEITGSSEYDLMGKEVI